VARDRSLGVVRLARVDRPVDLDHHTLTAPEPAASARSSFGEIAAIPRSSNEGALCRIKTGSGGTMHLTDLTRHAGACALLALVCVRPASAQFYSATVIAPVNSSYGFSGRGNYAINSRGQVSGFIVVSGNSKGFIWTPSVPNGTSGTTRLLSYSNYPTSQVNALNVNGDAAGWALSAHSSASTGLLWPSGGAGQVIASNAYQASCEGINDSGDIALFYSDAHSTNAGPAVSRLVNGKRTLYLIDNHGAWPRSINNADQVIGNTTLYTPNAAKTSWIGVNIGVMGSCLNNAGAVAGSRGDVSGYSRPAVYVPTQGLYGLNQGVNDLWPVVWAAVPGSWNGGDAQAINELGVVVGNVNGPWGAAAAWMWDSSAGAREITVSGWTNLQVSGMNGAGQIVATGTNDGGVTRSCILLTPQ
jgi:hypothetical protein